MGTSGFVGQNPRTESGFIGAPGGANLFRTTAQLHPASVAVDNVDAPKFQDAAAVKAAYRAGKLDKDSAAKILQEQFGYK